MPEDAVSSVTTRARLADDVYLQLRDDILVGRLRPRDHLVEVDLAQRLNVSRTPVRESLQRLAADGLIVSYRRRWVVYEHTLEEIVDLFEVRMALEGYAARLACQRATQEQLALLKECFDNRPPATIGQGQAVFAEFNATFHELITEAANNTYFQRLADSNRFYTFNSQLVQHYDRHDVEDSNTQHEEILGAIMARNPDTAERAARAHVEFSLRLIRERVCRPSVS